jgi:hypothetical protein
VGALETRAIPRSGTGRALALARVALIFQSRSAHLGARERSPFILRCPLPLNSLRPTSRRNTPPIRICDQELYAGHVGITASQGHALHSSNVHIAGANLHDCVVRGGCVIGAGSQSALKHCASRLDPSKSLGRKHELPTAALTTERRAGHLGIAGRS